MNINLSISGLSAKDLKVWAKPAANIDLEQTGGYALRDGFSKVSLVEAGVSSCRFMIDIVTFGAPVVVGLSNLISPNRMAILIKTASVGYNETRVFKFGASDIELTITDGALVHAIDDQTETPDVTNAERWATNAGVDTKGKYSNPFYYSALRVAGNKKLAAAASTAKPQVSKGNRDSDSGAPIDLYSNLKTISVGGQSVTLPEGVFFLRLMPDSEIWLLGVVKNGRKDLRMADILANEEGGVNIPAFLMDQSVKLRTLSLTYQLIAMSMEKDAKKGA